MTTPPRKGNVPRVGGWVAWRRSPLIGQVVRIESDVIGVRYRVGLDWKFRWVPYGDVYPCEGP